MPNLTHFSYSTNQLALFAFENSDESLLKTRSRVFNSCIKRQIKNEIVQLDRMRGLQILPLPLPPRKALPSVS